MTNTVELEVAILRSRLTKKDIANELHLSRAGLYNKIRGLYEFKGSEIEKLSEMLSLTQKEKQSIFFCCELN